MKTPRQPSHTRCGPAAPRGLTLAEMIVSMSVTGLILVGLGSVMLVTGRAMPDTRSPARSGITSTETAEQLAAELQYATEVLARSATMIDFAVADRDGNDMPERIRYAWSGVPGDPLTRRYNAGPIASLGSGLQAFSLSFDKGVSSQSVSDPNENVQETLLIYHYQITDLTDYPIKSDRFRAQYFRPSLAADALHWRVTSVEFFAKVGGSAQGRCQVQLQWPSAGGLPSGQVLDEKTLHENQLTSTYLKQQVDFTSASGIAPGQGLCLVFAWAYDAEACQIQGQDKNGSSPNTRLLESTDRGVTWSEREDESLLFWINGTVTTAGQPPANTTWYLGRVGIRLSGGDDVSTVCTGVNLLNKPEVTE